MIDRHSLENVVAEDISAPFEAAPLLIGEALSQHEQALDKVLYDWPDPYWNALQPVLLAHDARSSQRGRPSRETVTSMIIAIRRKPREDAGPGPESCQQ